MPKHQNWSQSGLSVHFRPQMRPGRSRLPRPFSVSGGFTTRSIRTKREYLLEVQKLSNFGRFIFLQRTRYDFLKKGYLQIGNGHPPTPPRSIVYRTRSWRGSACSGNELGPRLGALRWRHESRLSRRVACGAMPCGVQSERQKWAVPGCSRRTALRAGRWRRCGTGLQVELQNRRRRLHLELPCPCACQ